MYNEPYKEALRRLFLAARRGLVQKAINEVEQKIKSIEEKENFENHFNKLKDLSKELADSIFGKAKKKREAINNIKEYLNQIDKKDIKQEAHDKLKELGESAAQGKATNDGKRLEGEEPVLQVNPGSLPHMRKRRKNRSRPKVQQQSVRGTQPTAAGDNHANEVNGSEPKK